LLSPPGSASSKFDSSATDEDRKKRKKEKKKKKKRKKEREKFEWVEKTKESCVTKVLNENGEKVKITEKKEHIVRHIPNNGHVPSVDSAEAKKPKTVEVKEAVKISPPKLSTETSAKVPTKIWDQPMFKSKESASKSAPVESKGSVWDFLKSNRGLQGYGGKDVKDWDDKPVKAAEEKRRKTDEDSDDEMDKGRVKKVKSKPSFGHSLLNPFQKHYEAKSTSGYGERDYHGNKSKFK